MKKQRVPEVHYYEFRVTAWLTSLTRLTTDLATRGLYRDLLDVCYKDGWIPADHASIAAVGRCSEVEVAQIWPRISRHFYPDKHDPSKLRNRPADAFRKDYFSYIRKQSERGRKGGQKSVPEKPSNVSDIESTGLATAKPPLKHPTSQYDTIRYDTKQDETKRDDTGGDLSLVEPFDQFHRAFSGPFRDNTYQTFVGTIKTAEDCRALLDNTPLWMKTKRYADGFYDSCQFLKSGVWRKPPDPNSRAHETLQEKTNRLIDERRKEKQDAQREQAG